MRKWLIQFVTVFMIGVSGARISIAQGYSPDEAERRMTVAAGLKATLFASEPMVRQVSFVKCDDRGRLWTIQYLQYPNPAGLKRVKVDRWSRTEYDRVPEPPPHGPRGADRITILEDKNGDGRADTARDFIDGLNFVSGVEFGYGGVYVLNPPYLLFYPDANRDDIPDDDPEVLLTGFGIEDAQSLANHLSWGPDGWLYGVNGSTTTCRIRGVEFQQGVWRFHPVTHEFELFCEGGSNCYGLTFDANGELYYSTNAGPFVNAVQGGYFYKSFGKHGPLHNLHAYHYFPELECDEVPGGPPTGGTIYLADALPTRFCGAFLAGNFLGHTVSWWTITPKGSTVTAKYGGVLADAHDTWCGPTDLCVGPDGAIYVSDFYDQRTAHPDPDANWDRSNGRIYKISPADANAPTEIDLAKLSSDGLVDLLSNSNHWYAARARVELALRRDAAVVNRLREMALQTADSQLALEGLWALNATTEIDDEFTLKLLKHPQPYVRYWTIRLVGDRRRASPKVVDQLAELAGNEASANVRGQLAATAKRLAGDDCLQLVGALLRSHPNESDARIPWLIWWAYESKAISDAPLVVDAMSQRSMWNNPAARNIVKLLVRRFAAEGTSVAYDACAKILQSAPSGHVESALDYLRKGLAERGAELQGVGQGTLYSDQAADGTGGPAVVARHYETLTPALRDYISGIWQQQPHDVVRLELALRAGLDNAYPVLKRVAFQAELPMDQRMPVFALLREFGRADLVSPLLEQLKTTQSDAVKNAALDVVVAFDTPAVGDALMNVYSSASKDVQRHIRDVLFSRPASALAFLMQVDAKRFTTEDVGIDQLRHLALHKNAEIDALVRKHWGNIGPGSSEEKLATMRRFNNDLRAGTGDPVTGKLLFEKNCGTCHRLFDQGKKIGPDLTTANRTDWNALLANLVDPSAVIRTEFMNYVVVTTTGRVLTGVMTEQDAASVTIVDASNQSTKIQRSEVDELREAEVSLMPERILEKLSPQELRDLFAYLQSPKAL